MPTTPWKKYTVPDLNRTYVAFLTYLPLKRYRTAPRFLFYTVKILVQLSQSNGLIGYSLRADLFNNSYWTLSAWKDESALRDFGFKGFHKSVMKLLRSDMGSTRFMKWAVGGREIPLSWEDASRRIRTSDNG